MQPKTPGLLWDIEDAAKFILEQAAGATYETYVQDRMLRLAVERNFGVIGEAARRLANHDPETASRLSGLPRMIAYRNVLAHGYDEVNNAEVWEIIQDVLPTLKVEVEQLLREAEDGTP
ncbi:MAG: HepT-like ribonuclease domain-containing protein [Thermomicrobiales bacterium]